MNNISNEGERLDMKYHVESIFPIISMSSCNIYFFGKCLLVISNDWEAIFCNTSWHKKILCNFNKRI